MPLNNCLPKQNLDFRPEQMSWYLVTTGPLNYLGIYKIIKNSRNIFEVIDNQLTLVNLQLFQKLLALMIGILL
jgi:hypothetical protein